ncbi:uncharacterized protein LOC128991312 [Macrosteles quadrilineatus]|uniref:uncharacterized protein LOC128991312 n=1 Tax=Macrosteles quadrilineatus TaxID=74068 RepID=UPI0023E2C188|nr:uncharacterized protein LOC128991312 [Macrosteles quadrilineatus]XP_054270088.1 uncharacterized protein LOC128991312 [Macrosteles quadrilineatus]XP_054270089.1 uncharacterized protein LOC128991312 [Macrosteles quadrilineatus]
MDLNNPRAVPEDKGMSPQNTLWERIKFNSYEIDDEQTIHSNIDNLKKLASTCGFGSNTEARILEKIITEYSKKSADFLQVLEQEDNVSLKSVSELIEKNISKSSKCMVTNKEEKHTKSAIFHQKIVSKDEIDTLIDSSLMDGNGMTLNEIKMCLESKLSCSLSQDDKDYMKEKYVESLMELWLDETSDNASSLSNDPLELLEKLRGATSLQDCFGFGMGLPYNDLMITFCKDTKYLDSKEKQVVMKFKSVFLAFLLLQATYLQGEITFQTNLILTLKRSKDVEIVGNMLDLVSFLESKEDETICFKKLLRRIISCSALESSDPLRIGSEAILYQDKYYFVKYMRDIIVDYLKPFVIEEKTLDGRKLLEVKGEHIVIGKVLEHIESHPGFRELEEIRFVNAGVIHIDENLNSKIWHGKNIVLLTETIIVSKESQITWDVSGHDAHGQGTELACTSSEDKGDGVRGRPGESGGNVMIICDEIENAPYLKIVSNGGKGGHGQDGSIGGDGVDGDYIGPTDFRKNFPPVCKFLDNSKREHLEETRLHLIEDLQTVKLSIFGKLESLSKKDFDHVFQDTITKLEDIYFEGKTKTGCKIFFSFHYAPIMEFSQSFLLIRGADGEPGKKGGKGGEGGEGGFAGEIHVVSKNTTSSETGIIICTDNGKDGNHGKSGSDGKPGKSGLDCAYIDSTKPKLPFFSEVHFPKFFFTNHLDNQRLKVEYKSNEAPERIFCPHNSQYGEIVNTKKEFYRTHTMSYDCCNTLSEKEQTHNQYKIQGNRKKTINFNSIIEQYKDITSMSHIQKIDIFENDIKQMYDEIIEEEMLKEEKVTLGQRVTRSLNFSLQNNKKVNCISLHGVDWKAHSSPTACNDVSSSNNKSSDWHDLLKENIGLQELRTVLDKINFQTTSPAKSIANRNPLILRNKYQLAILNHLEKSPELHTLTQGCRSYNQKVLGSIDNTLTVVDNSESISEVESYLCSDSQKNRLNIIEMLENISNDGIFCMKIFNIYLNNNLDDCEKFLSDKHLVAYTKHYNWFKTKKAKSMHSKLLPILNHLSNDDGLYRQLVKAIFDQNIFLEIDVEHQIRSNYFLNICYEKYVEEVNKPFEWKSILITQQALTAKLVEGFKSVINHKGHTSALFREVVAQLFKTNVLLYQINEYNQMVLTHNHNPSADQIAHILIRDNKCLKLETHEGMCQLIGTLEEKGEICKKIQFHVDSVIEKAKYREYLDEFLCESPFIQNTYNGVSKSTMIKIKINHMLMEDEYIEMIKSCFKNDEKQLLDNRLKMLKHDCVGYQSYLYYIALRLKTEETRISVEELCFIINFVLKSILESPLNSNIVSWILSSQHHTNWIVEFILLKLELYFKKSLENELKKSWRKCLCQANRDTCMLLLSKLDCDQSLQTTDDAGEILLLISLVSEFPISLSELCLSDWKYYLKDVFWISEIINTGDWSVDELKEASFYLSTLENSYGKELCCKFTKVVRSHSKSINSQNDKLQVFNTLKLMTNKEYLFNEKLLEILSKSNIHKWEEILRKECFPSDSERSLCQLRNLIESGGNTSKLIRSTIDETTLSVESIRSIWEFLKGKMEKPSELKSWISNLLEILKRIIVQRKNCPEIEVKIDHMINRIFKEMKEHLTKLKGKENISIMTLDQFILCNLENIVLATICTSIYMLYEKKMLRNTQLITILTFLKTNKNVLGQVSTGEGKSFVIIAVAIMKTLVHGSKVDIITSSHVLAKRDAHHYKALCSLFNLDVGHNCSENIDERKTVYSKCQVVYGELSYFQRDFLLDRVYNHNILGDRTYETIIVDEVDSMLLDKANNVLYLSHDIPGLDKLEPLFVFIWKCLNISSKQDKPDDIFNVDNLKEMILNEMYGKITIEDIRNINSIKIDDFCAHQIWTSLIEKKVIGTCGKVFVQQYNKSFDGLKDLSENKACCSHMEDIEYLLKKVIHRKRELEIPCYLQNFAEDHLDKWIDSAITALNLQNNIDYVVDVDRSNSSSDRNPNIIIVDRDTGTDMTNSQWDDGLHQFLQLKHGCRLSHLTFKAVFISNVSYLKMYETLLGLTGTLGSIRERELLEDVYNVEFVTIPTAKPKRFNEEIPILCNSFAEWSTKIVEKVYQIADKRSVLVICQSLSEVFTLKKCFESHQSKLQKKRHIHTYTRDYEQFSVENLDVGHIIISTNLAGRGTDIQLSDELIQNGGLHVCLTFLPNNCRIEEQAFGRAARNGQPGSGQMMFKHYVQGGLLKVTELKKERDMNEILRVSHVKKYYDTKIKPEEDLFCKFQEKYKLLVESKHCKEIKAILLMTCLDEWAYWLEKSTNSKNEIPISDVMERISKLANDDFDVWSKQVLDPFQLTKLGLFHLNNDNEKAIKLFERVIHTEPRFSVAARYYNTCARTLKDDISKKDCKELISELKAVQKEFKNLSECSLFSGTLIDYVKTHNERNIIQTDSFKQQQEIVSKTYEVFISSIHSIIGYNVTPEDFQIALEGTHVNAKVVPSIIFRDLIEKEVILEKLKDDITERDLIFSLEYGVCPRMILRMILNNCNHTRSGVEEFFLKQMKRLHLLPSREMFWKELISAGLLENEEKYVIVNCPELNDFDPSLADEIQNFQSIDINTSSSGKISLYSKEELGLYLKKDGHEVKNLMFNKDILKRHLGPTKYKFLKQENVFLFNKQASFSKINMETVKMNHFDSVTLDDFLKIGIPKETALSIIGSLINENVISKKNDNDPLQYELLVNWEGINNIELKSHKYFLSDVKAVLEHCFSFRIAIQKLIFVKPDCEGNYNNLVLPLQVKLYKRFWLDLLEQEIIEKRINHEKNYSETLEALYSSSMDKAGFIKIFSKFYDKEKSERIVDELIEKHWLKKTIGRSKRQLYVINNKIEEETTKNEKLLAQLSKNTSDSKTIEQTINNHKIEKETKQVDQLANLSKNISDSKTIKQILLIHLVFSKNVNMIKSNIEDLAGEIHQVTTPKFSLKSLEIILKEHSIPTSEINMFTMNGFNQVINLEEKKYTKMMKIGVFYVTALGLAEIAAGVCLEVMGSPFGLILLAQGIDDIIFASGCFFSGHFSWKDYRSQKIVSLVTSAISCYALVRSAFAKKTVGMSAGTMKDKLVQGLSKVKSSVKSIFSSEGMKQVAETEVTAFGVWKRVLFYCAEGVARGAKDHLMVHMHSQIVSLGTDLSKQVHEDMERTIINHQVFETATELCKKGQTTNIINVVNKVCQDNEMKVKKSLESIQLGKIFILIERFSSKTFKRKSFDLDSLDATLKLLQNLFNFVRSLKIYLTEILGLVTNVLNDMQRELVKSLNMAKNYREQQEIGRHELDSLQLKVLEKISGGINGVFATHITTNIVSPILRCVETCVEKGMSQVITKGRRSYLTDKEMVKWNSSKKTCVSKKSKANAVTKHKRFSRESDEITCELFKMRQNRKALASMIPQNAAVKTDCLDIFCKIIPVALKQEHLSVPALSVEVENHNTKNVYHIGDVTDKTPTVKFNPNADLSSNLWSNRILLKDFFIFLNKSFMKHYPEYSLVAQKLQEIVVKKMEEYLNRQSDTPFDEDQFVSEERMLQDLFFFEINQINTECERKNPYQHAQFGGGWTFSPSVDVDLREKEKIINVDSLQSYVNNAFERALTKVNMHIHRIQSKLSYFNLALDDFAITKHQIAPPPPDMSEVLNCYAIQYELVVPVLLENVNRLVDFNIILHLENVRMKHKSELKSPLGPHIRYEINPAREMKFLNKGLKGHILLHSDCIVNSYSLTDCHVAGELIVSSALLPPVSIDECENSVEKEANVTSEMTTTFTSPIANKRETSIEKEANVTSEMTMTFTSPIANKRETSIEKEANVTVEMAMTSPSPSVANESGIVSNRGAPNTCDAVIIGDSLFKYIEQYVKLPKCDFKICPYIEAHRFVEEIIPFIKNYQSLKCVVIFLGNDAVKDTSEHQSPEPVVTCLDDLVHLLQKNIRNTEIIVCTMTFVKQPADRFFQKISEANRMLIDFCEQKNVVLFDSNKIICPRDLLRDGIHLNRSGYYKLGKHISELCLEIINSK